MQDIRQNVRKNVLFKNLAVVLANSRAKVVKSAGFQTYRQLRLMHPLWSACRMANPKLKLQKVFLVVLQPVGASESFSTRCLKMRPGRFGLLA